MSEVGQRTFRVPLGVWRTAVLLSFGIAKKVEKAVGDIKIIREHKEFRTESTVRDRAICPVENPTKQHRCLNRGGQQCRPRCRVTTQGNEVLLALIDQFVWRRLDHVDIARWDIHQVTEERATVDDRRGETHRMNRLSHGLSPATEKECCMGSWRPDKGMNFVKKQKTRSAPGGLSGAKDMSRVIVREVSIQRLGGRQEYIRRSVLLLPTTQQQLVFQYFFRA
jgi:hypothetical protein